MNRWDSLTEREKVIVRAVVIENKKSLAVACDLGISERRVKDLIGTIYRLLELRDRVDLALWVGQNYDLVMGKPGLKIVKGA
jgi:DNA-binding CsgD family transcriptional regulator